MGPVAGLAEKVDCTQNPNDMIDKKDIILPANFLRHVAPTRYGHQTFAAGEHLLVAPGFSQWRLALAA